MVLRLQELHDARQVKGVKDGLFSLVIAMGEVAQQTGGVLLQADEISVQECGKLLQIERVVDGVLAEARLAGEAFEKRRNLFLQQRRPVRQEENQAVDEAAVAKDTLFPLLTTGASRAQDPDGVPLPCKGRRD